MSRCLLCNSFGLLYELLPGGFSCSLGSGGCCVFLGGKSFDRRLWKISFTRVRRSFTTFSPPFLGCPVFKGLLWGFHFFLDFLAGAALCLLPFINDPLGIRCIPFGTAPPFLKTPRPLRTSALVTSPSPVKSGNLATITPTFFFVLLSQKLGLAG